MEVATGCSATGLGQSGKFVGGKSRRVERCRAVAAVCERSSAPIRRSFGHPRHADRMEDGRGCLSMLGGQSRANTGVVGTIYGVRSPDPPLRPCRTGTPAARNAKCSGKRQARAGRRDGIGGRAWLQRGALDALLSTPIENCALMAVENCTHGPPVGECLSGFLVAPGCCSACALIPWGLVRVVGSVRGRWSGRAQGGGQVGGQRLHRCPAELSTALRAVHRPSGLRSGVSCSGSVICGGVGWCWRMR